MADAIFAAVLGVVISRPVIATNSGDHLGRGPGRPQWAHLRHQRPDDDAQTYLRLAAGRREGVAQGNAAVRRQQQHDISTEQERGR